MPDLFENYDEEPDRADEIDDIAVDYGDKSASETEATFPNDSDLTITYKKMFPRLKTPDIDEMMQLFMVSRIFPDTYLHKKFLTVISFKTRHPEIPIMTLENYVDSAMSIGYNGKARVEIVVVQGSSSAKAEENEERGNL